MTRILAVSDEIDRSLSVDRIREIAPDLVIACGDLPDHYLEYLASASNRHVLFVPGNHDRDFQGDTTKSTIPLLAGTGFGMASWEDMWDGGDGPGGCDNIDGVVHSVAGLRVAGLGGSIRYRPGPNQYTDKEMTKRAHKLARHARKGHRRAERAIDILVAHSPPLDLGDGPDGPHRGFAAFHDLITGLRPRYMLHGHVHPHGFHKPDRTLGDTTIMNVIPHRVLEV